jgi:hypothetical protein
MGFNVTSIMGQQYVGQKYWAIQKEKMQQNLINTDTQGRIKPLWACSYVHLVTKVQNGIGTYYYS